MSATQPGRPPRRRGTGVRAAASWDHDGPSADDDLAVEAANDYYDPPHPDDLAELAAEGSDGRDGIDASAFGGRRSSPVRPVPPAPAADPADEKLAQLRDNDAAIAASYSPVDWDALFADDDLDPDWLIPDILERGENAVIYAPAKTGKSLVTLDMMAALASGRARLGRPATEPMRLLYIDQENSRKDLHRRLAAMGYTAADLTSLIYLSFSALPPLDTMQGGAELTALVRHHGADIVVLDSTSRVVDGSEQESDTYRAMYRHTIRHLKPLGTTIVRLDNSGKDVGKGQRGSSAKADDIDVAWELTRQRGGEFRFRCTHDRSGVHPEQVHVERLADPLRHVVTAAPGPMSTETLHPAINKLIDALDAAGAPNNVGRDKARSYLPAGFASRNEDLSAAVKARKQRDLSGPAPGPDPDDRQHAFEDGWP